MLGQWSVRLVRRNMRKRVPVKEREPIKLNESLGTDNFQWVDRVAKGALIVTGVVTAGVAISYAVDSGQCGISKIIIYKKYLNIFN